MPEPTITGDRVLLLLVIVLWLPTLWRHSRRRIRRIWERTRDRFPRRWKPRTPKNCPHCCGEIALSSFAINREVTAYAERKSSRGRKKGISTQGYACPHVGCEYYGVTDEERHALVGNGKRGKGGHIQHFRCQWCRRDFTCRRNTPLYYLKTDPKRVEMVLWLLAEGVDISVMVRYTGHADATITRWLERMGRHSERLHDLLFRRLSLPLVQLDELHTKVRSIQGALWVWLAIDPVTKILPAMYLGRRRQYDAYALLHDLKLRLGCVPAFTSDGYRPYFYAITAHFGSWFRPKGARTDHWQVSEKLLYGQLVKRRQRRSVTFTLTRMLWGTRRSLNQLLRLYGYLPTIQTAFIERVNLTLRRGVAPLARRTWSLAQSPQHLWLHLQWWRCYYHLVRDHESLALPVPGLPKRQRQRTPAMAAAVTDCHWSVGQILKMPLYAEAPA